MFPAPDLSAVTVRFRVGHQLFAVDLVPMPGATWERLIRTIEDTDRQWIAALEQSVQRWAVADRDTPDDALVWVDEFTLEDAATLWNDFPAFVRSTLADEIRSINMVGGDSGKVLSQLNDAVERLTNAIGSSPPPPTPTVSQSDSS